MKQTTAASPLPSQFADVLALMDRNLKGGADSFCHFEESVNPQTLRLALRVCDALSRPPSAGVLRFLVSEDPKTTYRAMAAQLLKEASV